MIELKNLTFAYENSGEKVLKDLNLKIEDGEFLCVIGHSGCGKSTLIHLLAGLEKVQEGEILRDGKNMNQPGTDRAVVFQHYSLFPWMTVKKNVVFPTVKTGRFTKEEAGARAELFLDKVGMAEHGGKYPFQLSGGMRQRTSIARALAMDSDVLLLDEPFGALDYQNRGELQRLLQKLWLEDKKTVIFVTHDLDEAMLLATRIVFIKNGRADKDLRISERINQCCAKYLKYDDCKALRASLEAWFQ